MNARRSGRGDSRRYLDWLARALADIRAARILREHGGDNEVVAFHCQQAIEKALKGYLLFKTRRHFDGHSLVYLCRQALRHDTAFEGYLDESAVLNDFYISTRYPTDTPFDISENEETRIFNMAEEMLSMIRREMEDDGAQDAWEDEGPNPAPAT